MDSILVEIGLDTRIHKGDEVVLLGRQGKAEIPIYEWCEKLKTIPYEITCNISDRLPRVYINDKE
jgi:alanine racemase